MQIRNWNFEGGTNEEKRKEFLNYFRNILSSSNINVLLGAGFCMPLLKCVNDIENRLSEAIDTGDKSEEIKLKKEFFTESIAPLLEIADDNKQFQYEFISILKSIIERRKTPILHTSFNVFTTNYDNIIETALETRNIEYYDGFSGRIAPKFSTANYGRLLNKQTNTLGKVSNVLSANLYKLHGSLYWIEKDDNIVFENFISRIKEINDNKDDDEKFLELYNKLAIINPTKDKLNTTVLKTNYYDQFRIFSNELERENSIVIAFGFSFADEHIQQVITRALKSNPTLTLLLFPYSENTFSEFERLFRDFGNVICYTDEKDGTFTKFELEILNAILREVEQCC